MIKTVKDPGFGYGSQKNLKDIVNKDGSSNVIHKNRAFKLDDFYAIFINLRWWKFFLFILLGYTFLNVMFAGIYVLIGIEQITPTKGNVIDDFLNGFFFSAQTLTTVGYGGIAPKGLAANLIAAFEAMIGLLSFSFITGLLYGRFSKAKAALRFSDSLIVREFKGERALMFRVMNSRKSVMIEPEITVTLSINERIAEGHYIRNFYELTLERDKIIYLPTIWTIVHEINEESPFYKYSNEEMKALDAELYALVQYHEQSYDQKVYQISSYDFTNVQLDVRFIPSFSFDKDGYTVLDHDKLNDVEHLA